MSSIYEDIKQVFAELSGEKGHVNNARKIIEHLVKSHGVDRGFIETCIKTLAAEKMTFSLLDEMESKRGDKPK